MRGFPDVSEITLKGLKSADSEREEPEDNENWNPTCGGTTWLVDPFNIVNLDELLKCTSKLTESFGR
jgi:hypothetical protein